MTPVEAAILALSERVERLERHVFIKEPSRREVRRSSILGMYEAGMPVEQIAREVRAEIETVRNYIRESANA